MPAPLQISGQIPATHPALPGHFPGHPVVPGVILLQQVIETAQPLLDGRAISGVRRIKFLSTLMPETPFFVSCDTPGASGLRFRVQSADGLIAEGQLALAGSTSPECGSG